MTASDIAFDRFIFVDWSASAKPTKGANSIWIGSCSRDAMGTVDVVNSLTRKEALTHLQKIITNNKNKKTLIGFDFGFGYPHKAYQENMLGEKWDDLWGKLYAEVLGKEKNTKGEETDRFDLANRWNEKYKLCFWSKPNGKTYDEKHTTLPRGKDEKTEKIIKKLKEFRITEERVRWSGVKSQWQLYGAGSVGSQTLFGIPYAYELRKYLKENNIKAKVWPFETEFGKDLNNFDVLMCEVHFAAIARVGADITERIKISPEVKDRVQVEEMCRFFAEEDKDESMLQKFLKVDCDCVSDADKEIAQTKEGWILGVPLCLQPCDRPHKK